MQIRVYFLPLKRMCGVQGIGKYKLRGVDVCTSPLGQAWRRGEGQVVSPASCRHLDISEVENEASFYPLGL